MSQQEERARSFRALHKPGQPLVLANSYDIISARAIAGLPSCRALATASYGVAQCAGVQDDDLTLPINLSAIEGIARVANEAGKPLTADLQDGYGDQLSKAIESVIEFGVVGVNLEDFDRGKNDFYSLDEAVKRIGLVQKIAKDRGVPSFCVNARCDLLLKGYSLEDVIKRGKAYLEAGANTVFVWGGRPRGTSREEVERLAEAFGGMLNVSKKLTPDGLSVQQLSEIGIARISVGPALQMKAMSALSQEAEALLDGKL